MSKSDDAAANKKPVLKPWTVLVYMVADDPSGGEVFDAVAHRELDRIIHGALSCDLESMHVAVQVDFRKQPFVWRRVVGQKSWVRPESNAADPKTLYGFFNWAKQECPSDKILLILWGHSEGLFGFFKDDSAWQYVAQTLTLPELREALQAAKDCHGRKIDVIAFKDCAISTLETAFELRDHANYLLATQGMVPAEGWPYRGMLGSLVADAKESALGIHKALAAYYRNPEHLGKKRDVPISLLDTGAAAKVADELASLTKHLTALRKDKAGKKAIQRVFSDAAPGDKALIEMRTFCTLLRRLKVRTSSPEAKSAVQAIRAGARKLDSAIAGNLVLRNSSRMIRGKRAVGGVSLFIYPSTKANKSALAKVASSKVYSSLALAIQTKWDDIALQAMPREPVEMVSLTSFALAGDNGGPAALLPAILLEQLQRSGKLEQIQLDGVEWARQALFGLANLGPGGKGGDLGPGGKGGDLGPGGKGGDLGPGGKGGDLGLLGTGGIPA